MDTDAQPSVEAAVAADEHPPADPAGASRRRWVLPVRLLASVVMMAVVIWKIPDFDPNEAVPSWGWDNSLWLAAAALLTLAGIVLSTWRWQTVLHALGLEGTRHHRLLSHYLAGQFVSNVLPTTIGGDVLRVSRLSKENGETEDTFASVVIERLTGWLVLPIITIIGFLVNPGLRELGKATTVAVAISLATLFGLALILLAADHERVLGSLTQREGWLRFIGAVHLGVNRMRRHPAAALSVISVGLLYQFVLVLAATAAAYALGIQPAGLTVLLAFLPAVLIAQVLPIGISGLGVRESAFVLFLTPLGVPPEQAIALGLLLYLLNLGVSLIGAPAFAVGGRTATSP